MKSLKEKVKESRRSRTAAEKLKKVVKPEQQSKKSTREGTSSYSKVSEDTAPTTSAVGKSPASVESSHETHSDSLTDTVIAATGADESDNVCCKCFVPFEEDIAMGNQAEWTQCACKRWKRWMHVDCISEIVVDSDGNLRVCSYCIL